MIGTLHATVMDCPDPLSIAKFYQTVLGGEVTPEDAAAEWINLDDSDGKHLLSFQKAPDYVAPTWPRNDVPLQMHVDIHVESYEAAEPTLFRAGAKVLDASPEHPDFRVYADPIGRPFCLVLG